MITSILREPVNALTHIAGAIASLVGLILLVVFASIYAGAWHIVSFSIFGATLLMMYTASSLYHAINLSEKGIAIMRRIDHVMIFLLIAGSYTPFCMIPLRGAWGWTLLSLVWGMALIGSILKIFFMNIPRWISTVIYLVMGWLCVAAIYPLTKSLETASLLWLIAGGVFYSTGAVIYGLKRPNPFPKVFGFHEIWHLFVLAGSFCHFWSVFKYLTYM
ncbi:MAG: hemolysin III family protein [Desulfamplus sp.]|nr:hemolysin III family protein [Desulfamplus sp.]MBF0413949.1 hemolysin III family protein [Desulfamplus sp.]